uniref:Sperm-associated antigen 1 n=1 Tax=Lygus hesperus TaxID=30085 RepID=A0A0A9YNB8_LYGHE
MSANKVPVVYYHERAKAHQLLCHFAIALQDYNVVLSRQPCNDHAQINRALVRKELHDFVGAAHDLQRALEHDTSSSLLSRLHMEDFLVLTYIPFAPPGNEDDNEVGENDTMV